MVLVCHFQFTATIVFNRWFSIINWLSLFWAVFFPPVEQIVAQCGKFQLLDKLVGKLLAQKHKVLNVSKDVLHISYHSYFHLISFFWHNRF